MAANPSTRWRLHRLAYGILAGSLAATAALALVTAGNELSLAIKRPHATALYQKHAKHTVNRVQKADRLQALWRPPTVNVKLPVGCEPQVSDLANAALAQRAGRCVS